MIKFNSGTLISSLLVLGFEKVDVVLYTYALEKIKLEQAEKKEFAFAEKIFDENFKCVIRLDSGAYKLKDGLTLSSKMSSCQDACSVKTHLTIENKEFIDYLASLDFSDINIETVGMEKIEYYKPLFRLPKPFNPNLWKPVVTDPILISEEYIIPDPHRGFVEYQAPEDRYEVKGVMPPAKNWIQQDLEEIAKELTLLKKKKRS